MHQAPNAGFGGAAGGAAPPRAANAPGLAHGAAPAKTAFGVAAPIVTNAGFGGSAGGANAPQHGGSAQKTAFGMPAPNAGFGGSAAPSSPRPHSPSQSNYPAQAQPQPSYPAQAQPSPQPPNGYPQYNQGYPQYPQQAQPTPDYPRAPSPYPSAAPYQQAMAPAAEPAPTKKTKSSRGLVIALVGVGAIGAGVAVAIAMSGGKKAGVGSRDELASQTLAALTKGDVDALIALGLPPKASFVSCDAEPDDSKIEEGMKALRKLYEMSVDKAKGTDVELVKLGDGRKDTMSKGKEFGQDCKLDSDIAIHTLDATLKVTGKGRTKERTEPLVMMEVDGRWYLMPPLPKVQPPGDCTAAAKATIGAMKKADPTAFSDAVVGRLTKAWEKHCNDDGWADEAIDCYGAKPASNECLAMLKPDQTKKLDSNLAQIVAEDKKSREVPTPTPAPDPVAAGSGSDAGSAAAPAAGSGSGSGSAVEVVSDELPSVCADWREQLDKLSKCRRIPLRMRKAYENDYDIVIKAWKDLQKKTEDMRVKTGESCQRGNTQVLEARKSFCR